MTICVAVAVYDGVVFAADSAVSIVGGSDANGKPLISNVYRHGNKVFNLIRGLPIVAMTCGMGNFGRAPIHTLTKELRRAMTSVGDASYVDPDNYKMEEVAIKVKNYFDAKYDAIDPAPTGPHSFDYWIGGFSSGDDVHEIWNIGVANGVKKVPNQPISRGDCGLVWGGQPEAINRLIMGFSPSIAQALEKAGMQAAAIQPLLALARGTTQTLLVENAMPMQDAVDLAEFLVDVTKRYVRFLPGADTVGGETDIAVVTQHERFKWIQRKHYYPTKLNPLETDHV